MYNQVPWHNIRTRVLILLFCVAISTIKFWPLFIIQSLGGQLFSIEQ